ncbi:MAG: glutathione ABC transporter permease [Candidatus Tectimicrobiota bacterium]|nr:MAG: glutathione ABC transporter permease [Candidatus Tectomicrobia bacterium]
MRTYVVRRLLQALLVCWGISLITFLILWLKGDPTLLLLPIEATEQERQDLRRAMGFDDPLVVQYWRFLKRAVRGDFGRSFFVDQPALELILERMPATVQLTVAGLGISLLLAIPLGALSAIKRGSLLDTFVTVFALTGQAMPIFWLGIMLIIVFAVHLQLFPVSGYGTVRHLVLPALTLGWFLAPVTMRLTRSGMLDVLQQDYIRTARAKGLPERAVIFKHALKNAGISIITIVGLQFGQLMGGAVVTETVFAWPGVASLAVTSIRNSDFPVVQAAVVCLALIIVVANLISDVLIGFLDPRIRYD